MPLQLLHVTTTLFLGNDMNYLITGTTGFAGPHLAKLLLSKGHTVYSLIRGSNGREMDLLDILTASEINSINWIYADLINYASVRQALSEIELNGVFHLAAQSHPPTSFKNPVDTFSSNVMGTVNLIDVIEKTQNACHFHFCSTSEVYGDDCKVVGLLKEDMPLHPINPYAVSKAAIDLYVQERIRNGFITGFITRAFSHTGPRRGYNFSISSDAFQIAQMMNGQQDYKLLVGNLKTRRVVMDVRDCVQAYYLLMSNRVQGVYNVCGEGVHEMQHFTNLLIIASGLKDIEQVIHKPFYRPIDIEVQIGDTSKLKSRIDWRQEYSIETTMKDLLSYWVKKLR